jgi:5-methylcytosine-specific restriction endonuclease McrA
MGSMSCDTKVWLHIPDGHPLAPEGPGSMTHTCTLYKSYGLLSACRCGRFWVPAGREMIHMFLISRDLRERLARYRRAVDLGDYRSLADAVRREADEAHARREKERERARIDWPLRQEAKRAQWLRHIRPIILGAPCAYCGGKATQIDHVMPASQGGTDARRNLAAACAPCNQEKGNRTPAQWKAWRLGRGRPWPPRCAPLGGRP